MTEDDDDRRSTRANEAMKVLVEEDGVMVASGTSLVAEAQAGSVAAFERLYRENVGRVHALCLRLCGDAAAAEEMTQDVFVRAWEKLHTFRGEASFSTWLHRLAVNVMLAQRRSDGRRSARVMEVEDLTIFDGRASVKMRVGERLDLEAAMATLPEATRLVFVMHEVEGYTHQEIADLTGRAEGTCKTLLHRARRMLKERLL
jgi:RNA polymerase sigma-70 factor (ECF subfamily)